MEQDMTAHVEPPQLINPEPLVTRPTEPQQTQTEEVLTTSCPTPVIRAENSPESQLEEVKQGEPVHELTAPKAVYREVMEPLKIQSSPMVDGTGYLVHGYRDSQEPGEVDTARLNKELKMLKRGLPVEPEAACYVCANDSRMDLMKVLVSGSVDTPYAHGLYQFDIQFPAGYPNTPPYFKLMTVGEGNAYFGPNLYSNGYVCLSIINTWEGDPEEMWQPERSSILQVLLSVQTLVMDNNILEKEPGYDGYEVHHPGNIAYCNIVKYLNMKFAVLEQLRNPPKEFAEVIVKHFTLKKEEVLRTLNAWAVDACEDTAVYGGDEGSGYNPWCSELFNSKTPRGAWAELKDEIEKEFLKLH
jgi:ubiquitin-protein ligase